MANVQTAAVQNLENAADTNQSLSSMTFLLRFLYTGLTSSSIPVKSQPDVADIETKLACVIDMATARAQLPISTIRKVYQTKLYVRVDEVLIALAYCAKQTHSPELRTLANSEAITLITDQDDFLLFVYYCAKISTVLRGERHSNFGHGMCRLVEKWYAKWSPVDLANMFGEHRSLHAWTHNSVITKAHMRTKKRGVVETTPANPPPASAEGAAGTESATGTASSNQDNGAASVLAEESHSTRATPTSTTATDDDDREHVFQFVFTKSSQDYLHFLEDKTELGPGAQRLKEIQILKTNENIDNAVQSIRQHKFTLEQMPAHLLENGKIWEEFLPTLSYHTLLKRFNTLKDFGFLNTDAPFARKFFDAIGDANKLKSENICPIQFYIQNKLYGKNVRYLGTKKAEYYEKKVLKLKIEPNPVIKDRLNEMFHVALLNAKPAPAKFFIVMDLRIGNRRKPILRNSHINCFEASFLLAYSIFAREKEALVYSFTGTKDKLDKLHDMMPKSNFKMAKEAVDLMAVAHTYQSLAKPIAEATAMKKKVDMFVVIVDSVARFCRQGQVPEKEFTEYKAKFNDHAKFVVVNLNRPKPDLKIPQTENMKGFFEICGFNEDTPKILNALAKHCFS